MQGVQGVLEQGPHVGPETLERDLPLCLRAPRLGANVVGVRRAIGIVKVHLARVALGRLLQFLEQCLLRLLPLL